MTGPDSEGMRNRTGHDGFLRRCYARRMATSDGYRFTAGQKAWHLPLAAGLAVYAVMLTLTIATAIIIGYVLTLLLGVFVNEVPAWVWPTFSVGSLLLLMAYKQVQFSTARPGQGSAPTDPDGV